MYMENYLNHIGKKVKQRIKIYELAFFAISNGQ